MKSSILIPEHIGIDFHKHGSRYFDCVYYSQFFEGFENYKEDWYNISFGVNL